MTAGSSASSAGSRVLRTNSIRQSKRGFSTAIKRSAINSSAINSTAINSDTVLGTHGNPISNRTIPTRIVRSGKRVAADLNTDSVFSSSHGNLLLAAVDLCMAVPHRLATLDLTMGVPERHASISTLRVIKSPSDN